MNRLVRRQRAALALFVALTVSGVGVAMATPQSGDQPTVLLDLSPNDGQNLSSPATLSVTGTGFPVNTSGILVQSADLPNGTTIISGTIGTFTSSPTGGFTTNVNVSQTFVPDAGGTPIDCNATGVSCHVEAFTNSGNANSRHTISFTGGGTTTTSTTTTTTTIPTTTSSTTTSTTTPTTTSSTTTSTTTPTTTSSTTTSTTTPTTTSSTTTSTTTPTTTSSTTTSTTTPTTTSSTTTSTTTPTTTSSTTTSTTTPTTSSSTTSTTRPPTTTTIVGPTTTLSPTICAQIRAARAQLNAQIDAARQQIINSGLSPQQQAASLAQLEAVRAQGNAQLDALLAGCPAP